jgi:hypothetical protein
MTITQRQVHLAFWLVLGPAMVLLVGVALFQRPANRNAGRGAEATVGMSHER